MNKIDLHVHSTASDGRFCPEEIIHKAVELGLAVVSLADHDSVDGIDPALTAAAAFPQLRFIPNVEISTDTEGGEVHILGYFIDHTDAALLSRLERFRNSRQHRARGMVEKLEKMGVHIEWPRVLEIAGTGSVGRPHVAQALLEKDYIATIPEAFERYIGRNGPAYVEREKVTPEEAVSLVLEANGLPALAHPFTTADTKGVVVSLKAAGLVALEAYYKDYSHEQRETLVEMAQRYDLIATGGTDYHGVDEEREVMMGDAGVPEEAAEQIIALAQQRGLKAALSPSFSPGEGK